MAEELNEITIDLIIDTNKNTYAESFDSIEKFIRYWNRFSGLPKLSIKKDNPPPSTDT